MAEQTAPNLNPDPMSAALEYASFGWRVIPIGPNKKHPPVPAWQDAATTDAEMIRAWWTGLYKDHGVGVATGATSRIFVVDVDVTEGKHGDETLTDLEAAHGALPATVEVQTGSGGRHLYFRYPRGRVIRNSATSRLGAGLDIRGEGGQVLAPPTIHPNGRPYVWVIGQGPLEHHIANAPAWLLDLVCDEPVILPDRKPTGTELVLPRPTDRPGDRWAETVTWKQLLEADGWTFHHHDKLTGEDHWTRPGKERHDGSSATTGYGPGDTLKVFTSSHPILKAEATYSKLGYLTETRFAGDYPAASRWCAEQVDGPRSSTSAVAPTSSVVAGDAAFAEKVDDEWTPASLLEVARAIQSGTYDPVTPTVMAVADSLPLFYAGRINSLFGESGGGKTWVALAAIAEQVRLGFRCAFIDYEDTPAGIAERLLLLGLTLAEVALVDYFNPTTGVGFGLDKFEARATSYALVVIDSTGEAMAAGVINPNDDPEVARWFVAVKRLTRLPGGPALLILDHIPKATDAPASYAIGSQRKRAAINGASYRVDTVTAPAKGKDGRLKLTVAKDRFGHRPSSSVAAMIEVVSDGTTVVVTVHLTATAQAAAEGKEFRPTYLMEAVSRYLEANPGESKNALEKAKLGKKVEMVRTALSILVSEGAVRTEAGPRGAVLLYVDHPYRQDHEVLPVDNSDSASPRPTSSHLVPTSSETKSTTSSHLVPSLLRDEVRDEVKWDEVVRDEVPVDNSSPQWEEF